MDTDSDIKIFTPKPANHGDDRRIPGEPLEPDVNIPIWQPHSTQPAQ